MNLTIVRGSFYLVGENFRALCLKYCNALGAEHTSAIRKQQERDENGYHITLIHKSELSLLNQTQKDQIKIDGTSIHILGVGKVQSGSEYAVYLLVYWPEGNEIRTSVGLERKEFHATLGFSSVDLHDKSKGISTMISLSDEEDIVGSIDAMKHRGDYDMLIEYTSMILRFRPLNEFALKARSEAFFQKHQYSSCINDLDCLSIGENDLMRKAECYYSIGQYEEALRTIWSAVFVKEEVTQRMVKALVNLQTKLGNIRLEIKVHDQINSEIIDRRPYERAIQLVVESQDETLSRIKKNSPLDVRYFVRITDQIHKMARNFSWVIPHTLAGMSTPRNAEDIAGLKAIGIKFVITLTEEEPLSSIWFDSSISNLFIPVPNYHPPSVEQMDEILYQIALRHLSCQGVLVHCGGGKGRAGTVLACYLLAFGQRTAMNLCEECKVNVVPVGCCSDDACCFRQAPSFSAPEVIEFIRKLRPESIETERQEEFVRKYCSVLWKRYSSDPLERVSVAGTSLGVRIEGVHQCSPQLMFLVGLPGSGKSWFAKQLVEQCPERFIRINQDEIGGRSSTEDALSHACKQGNKCIILD